MNKKWNQYVQKQIRSADDKPDTTKLIQIINLLSPEYPLITFKREPFLLFNSMTGNFVSMHEFLTEKDLINNFFHRTDIVFLGKNTRLIVEVDGGIHDIKTEQTYNRDKDYTTAKLDFMVVNEAELKLKLGVPKSNKLTPEQIATEIIDRIKKEKRLPS